MFEDFNHRVFYDFLYLFSNVQKYENTMFCNLKFTFLTYLLSWFSKLNLLFTSILFSFTVQAERDKRLVYVTNQRHLKMSKETHYSAGRNCFKTTSEVVLLFQIKVFYVCTCNTNLFIRSLFITANKFFEKCCIMLLHE